MDWGNRISARFVCGLFVVRPCLQYDMPALFPDAHKKHVLPAAGFRTAGEGTTVPKEMAVCEKRFLFPDLLLGRGTALVLGDDKAIHIDV